MIGNVFFQGDKTAADTIARNHPGIGYVRDARRTARPIWYYNLPTFSFDQLSLDSQLREYLRTFWEVIAACSDVGFDQSFLSIRTSNELGERAALWLSSELLGQLHELGLSLDFSDEPYIGEVAAPWISPAAD